MDRARNSPAQRYGKVIAIRPAGDSGITLTTLRSSPPRAARINAMFVWWPMAWFVAVAKVESAVARNAVFDLTTSLAFLIAVVMPVWQLGRLVQMARSTAHALKSWRRARAAHHNDPGSGT